jgi:hypothetical protein
MWLRRIGLRNRMGLTKVNVDARVTDDARVSNDAIQRQLVKKARGVRLKYNFCIFASLFLKVDKVENAYNRG